MKHFEDLWNECEKFQIDNGKSDFIQELKIKMDLYKMLSDRTDIPDDDLKGLKSRALGEIMFTLTGIVAVENINIYDALQASLLTRQANRLELRYPSINYPSKI